MGSLQGGGTCTVGLEPSDKADQMAGGAGGAMEHDHDRGPAGPAGVRQAARDRALLVGPGGVFVVDLGATSRPRLAELGVGAMLVGGNAE
jgi:hypothetical protein